MVKTNVRNLLECEEGEHRAEDSTYNVEAIVNRESKFNRSTMAIEFHQSRKVQEGVGAIMEDKQNEGQLRKTN